MIKFRFPKAHDRSVYHDIQRLTLTQDLHIAKDADHN